MNPTLILFTASFFIALAVIALNPMFPAHNRPQIFWGPKGQLRFIFLTTAVVIWTLSLVLWSLLRVGLFSSFIFILGTIFIMPLIVARVSPAVLTETAVGPIISAVVLLVLNYIAWS